MATDNFKVLAQATPAADTLIDLYVTPAATSTVVSTLTFCNRGSDALHFRFAVAVAGAADAPKQYIYYDLPLAPHDTFIATLGITLAAADVMRVQTDVATLSVNAFGDEVT